MAVATTRFSGRTFSAQEVTLIGEVVRECSGFRRMELVRTGVRAVAVAAPQRTSEGARVPEVARAARRSALVLPDKRQGRAVGSVTRVPQTAAGEPGRPLVGSVRDVEPLPVERVREPAQRLLFPAPYERRATGQGQLLAGARAK